MMPRGLDSAPNCMVLLVGVMIESLLVLLATLFVLRRFHGEQGTTGGGDVSEEVTYRWNEESTKSSEAATEDVKSANPSSDQKTDEMDSNHCHRVSNDNANNSITKCGKKQALRQTPKARVHVDSYLPSCAPLAFVRASKASEVASKLSSSMKAHQLDWALFTVTFVANSIFLITLYVSSFG